MVHLQANGRHMCIYVCVSQLTMAYISIVHEIVITFILELPDNGLLQ